MEFPWANLLRTLHDALWAILNASDRAVGQTRAVLQADLILLLPGGVPRARHSFQRGDDVMSSWGWDVKFDTIQLNERPWAPAAWPEGPTSFACSRQLPRWPWSFPGGKLATRTPRKKIFTKEQNSVRSLSVFRTPAGHLQHKHENPLPSLASPCTPASVSVVIGLNAQKSGPGKFAYYS